MNRSWTYLGMNSCGPKEPYIRWESRSHRSRGTFGEGLCAGSLPYEKYEEIRWCMRTKVCTAAVMRTVANISAATSVFHLACNHRI